MKKLIVLMMVLVVAASILSGCSKSSGEKVYVYNWGQYIDPDVVKTFEKETGIKVVYEDFESNEDMYAKIKANAVQYDVVCPSDYMIQKMINENLLAEINFDNVPNIKNIDPAYLESSKSFDPENKYSVPYCWGTLGILYNKTMVDGPIDSWSAIFDKKYSGNILMIDSVRDAFAIALAYLGNDINSTDETQLDQARDLLQMQYPLVQAYVVDQVRDKMIGGEAALGVIYSGEAIYTKRENPDLEYVVPKEGSNVWIDGWVIPKNSRNKENAEAFINFLCRSDIALKNFEYITYSTPNKEARDMITDPDIKNSPVAFPDQSVLNRCSTYRYLGDEIESLYMDKWNEVKSGLVK
jgi:spermidine/putrescine transport system substrate-binding protein